MPYLIASATVHNPVDPERFPPAVWRQVRQFNLPVQLALAAALEVLPSASNPSEVGVISVAPCEPGSYELNVWIKQILSQQSNAAQMLRMKPTLTLHMVDNLALSSFAISQSNHAECLGLGGAPGQAWVALETVCEWFQDGRADEVLFMAGDQHSGHEADSASLGMAWLFSRQPPVDRTLELIGVSRRRKLEPVSRERVHRDSASGVATLWDALRRTTDASFEYVVPDSFGDGIDEIRIRWKLSP